MDDSHAEGLPLSKAPAGRPLSTFLQILFEIVSDPRNDKYIAWAPDGLHFKIKASRQHHDVANT